MSMSTRELRALLGHLLEAVRHGCETDEKRRTLGQATEQAITDLEGPATTEALVALHAQLDDLDRTDEADLELDLDELDRLARCVRIAEDELGLDDEDPLLQKLERIGTLHDARQAKRGEGRLVRAAGVKLANANTDALGAFKVLEWAAQLPGSELNHCPVCSCSELDEHRADCAIAAAIGNLEAAARRWTDVVCARESVEVYVAHEQNRQQGQTSRAEPPAEPTIGTTWRSPDDDKLRVWNGATWQLHEDQDAGAQGQAPRADGGPDRDPKTGTPYGELEL